MDDLSDLWAFDLKTNQWELIHERSELHNGPGPRACHKMIFDPVSSQIFMLGRYYASKNKDIKSDFYLFDTNNRTWFLITDDTSQENGPGLIYDHQLCIDTEKRTIFVFGGKSMPAK